MRASASGSTPIAMTPAVSSAPAIPSAAKPTTHKPAKRHHDGVTPLFPSMPTREGSRFDAGYWKQMQGLAGHHVTTTPEIEHLPDDTQAFEARLALIRSAKSTIVLSTYELGVDAHSEQLLDALIERAKQNVGVILKFDAMAERFAMMSADSAMADRFKAKLQELNAAGGSVLVYGLHQQRARVGSGDHLKALLVDGKSLIFGSRNSAHQHFDDYWRDYDIRVGGTTASAVGPRLEHTLLRSRAVETWEKFDGSPEMDQRFRALLVRFHADIAAGKKAARAEERTALSEGRAPGTPLLTISHDPLHDKVPQAPGEHSNRVAQAIVDTINRASHELIITGNYINPGSEMMNAILAAAKRGVKVHIVSNGLDVGGLPEFPYMNARKSYEVLFKAGVTIWETTHFHHEKLIIADSEVAMLGSFNPERAAELYLIEQMTVSSDKNFVVAMRERALKTITEDTKPYHPKNDKPLAFWLLTMLTIVFPAGLVYLGYRGLKHAAAAFLRDFV